MFCIILTSWVFLFKNLIVRIFPSAYKHSRPHICTSKFLQLIDRLFGITATHSVGIFKKQMDSVSLFGAFFQQKKHQQHLCGQLILCSTMTFMNVPRTVRFVDNKGLTIRTSNTVYLNENNICFLFLYAFL